MTKVDSPAKTSAERAELSQDESDKLDLALKRGFEDTRSLDTQTVLQKMLDYREEIVHAAQVAKAEFDQSFDGLVPKSGSFGIDTINHGYFGYDSWDDIGSLTSGQTSMWLDDDSGLLTGSGGLQNPLTVGDPVVHLVLGVGTHAESPKISRVRWRLNDQPRPALSTEQAFRNTDVQVAWLDTPLLLQPDDDIAAQVYADADGEESPYLIGATFIKSKNYRVIDPENMYGSDSNNIVLD